MATVKRRSFASDTYWGRPLPNFGDPKARLLIVGLAPAAHGGNRTGRLFTGDPSGDWLYRALHKAGFANQPTATHIDDGLQLTNCAISNVCHCAPPDNKPLPEEITQCREWLEQTFALMNPRVVLSLGQIAWTAVVKHFRSQGELTGTPKFGHGVKHQLASGRWLVASYHPSQRNTATKTLTEPMFDSVFAQVNLLLRDGAGP